MIYYTGYAKFFSDTLETNCGEVTWQTWIVVGVAFFSQHFHKLTSLESIQCISRA